MEDEEIHQKKPPRIPKRYLAIAICFFVTIILYTTRNLLDILLRYYIPMQVPAVLKQDKYSCNSTIKNTTVTQLGNLYNWDTSILQSISLSFTWGYLASQLIGGVFADKIGARNVIMYLCIILTIWTAVCPLLIKYCDGRWIILAIWNAINGVLHGPTLPALDALLGQWVPYGTRTTAVALKDAGMISGHFVKHLFVTFIVMKTGQWSYPFYVCACLELVLVLILYCGCFSSPERHPTVTEKEKTMLREKLGPYIHFKEKKIPWKQILTSLPVWAYFTNLVGAYWAWWSVVTHLPAYLKFTLKVDMSQGLLLFTLCPMVTMTTFNSLFAVATDYLIRIGRIDVTTLRKIYANFGCMGAGIFVVSTTYVSCDQQLASALSLVAFTFLALFVTGTNVNALDLAPNFAGTLKGLASTAAMVVVAGGPIYLTSITKDLHLLHWREAFWISLAFYASGNLIFALACSAEERVWNIPPHLRKPITSDDTISM